MQLKRLSITATENLLKAKLLFKYFPNSLTCLQGHASCRLGTPPEKT